eukprot:symbB.v1.2.009674.t1/scaffold589.1/size183863/9
MKSLLHSMSALPSTFGAMAVPSLAEYLGAKWLMTAGLLIYALGCFLLGSSKLIEPWTSQLAGSGWGLCWTPVLPSMVDTAACRLTNIPPEVARHKVSPPVSSIFNAAAALGEALGPTLGTWLLAQGFESGTRLLSIFLIVYAISTHCSVPGGRPAAEQPSLSREMTVHTQTHLHSARDPELEEARAGQDFHCSAACSVLILEDPVFEKLLLSRLKADDLSRCAALICLDLKTPCTMMEDLRTWLEILKRITGELMQQLPLEEQDRLREEVEEKVASYQEPSAGSPEATATKGDATEKGDEVVVTYNLGIPLVIVVTRADTSNVLESTKSGRPRPQQQTMPRGSPRFGTFPPNGCLGCAAFSSHALPLRKRCFRGAKGGGGFGLAHACRGDGFASSHQLGGGGTFANRFLGLG